EDKTAFLLALDKEAKDFVKTDDYKKKKEDYDKQQLDFIKAEEAKKNFGFSGLNIRHRYPPHYFTLIKQMTTAGYFSSEIGMTKDLRYMETPGKWDGAYPYAKGEKAWAM
ncbi:MAG: gluconate 2-dehydrogenase subunit 3 family protein, partial [Chitinophagaceae bacterium]|nr:gluconate 2-dehydrogenase subunit 3 family protein [Chitinophagaceae bacterium]